MVLADLTGLSKPVTCDQNAPWTDYLYCDLENRAKAAPGAMFGQDAALFADIRSYLGGRFAGFDANFAIFGNTNTIYVRPKATGTLQEADKLATFVFENDPQRYDKGVIAGTLLSLKNEIGDSEKDFFFVVGDDVFEPMSVYDIKDIITAQQAQPSVNQAVVRAAAYAPLSRALPAATGGCPAPAGQTCYDAQSGSVIPCDKIIDYVEGLKDWWFGKPLAYITVFYADIKQLERLGYTVNRIHDKDFARDGIEFLKALINTPGQILALAFHGTGYVTDEATGAPLEPDGFIYPMGCIPNTVQAKTQLLGSLRAMYPCYLKQLPVEATQDPDTKAWNDGNVYFVAGRGCGGGNLGWGIRLYDTAIRSKAIEAGYPCHGELGAIKNTIATYLNPSSLKSKARARFDMKLFVYYLLGLGPGALPYVSPYNVYPPHLDKINNVDVQNIADYGGPCELNPLSEGCTMHFESCSKMVEGTNGIMRTVNVPCTIRPGGGNVHLFPYVTSLGLASGTISPDGDAASQIWFSDAIEQNPSLTFEVKRKPAIRSGPTRLSDDRLFAFSFIPEVEVVNEYDYNEYYKANKAQYIPKSILTIKGATAKANKIEMVGNPLAFHTSEDNMYKLTYFPYNKYFWNYNARASFGADIKSFKVNVPYKLHPWVQNLHVGSQFVQFDFSSDVETVSPCQVMAVDASQCTNLKAIYSADGGPRFINSDQKNGSDALQFALENDITLFQPGDDLPGGVDPSAWKHALKITLKSGTGGLRSYWKHFPLQGNKGIPSYWYLDRDKNGAVDAFERNSDTFPQTEGAFTVWIACAPRRSACCIPSTEGDYSYCEDKTPDECRSEGGTPNEGSNCFVYNVNGHPLSYNYYGEPGPGGQVKGMCPAHCPQKPQAFKYAFDQTNDNCICGTNPDGTYLYCSDYHSARISSVSGYRFQEAWCPGTFFAGSTGFGFNKEAPHYSCSDTDTLNFACAEDRCVGALVKETQEPTLNGCGNPGFPSRSGGVGCGGGSISETNRCLNGDDSVCTQVTTVTVSDPLCQGNTYAAQDNKGNIKCCKLNEQLDPVLGVCKPIYTGHACPTPSPSPSASSSPKPITY